MQNYQCRWDGVILSNKQPDILGIDFCAADKHSFLCVSLTSKCRRDRPGQIDQVHSALGGKKRGVLSSCIHSRYLCPGYIDIISAVSDYVRALLRSFFLIYPVNLFNNDLATFFETGTIWFRSNSLGMNEIIF